MRRKQMDDESCDSFDLSFETPEANPRFYRVTNSEGN